MLANVVNSSTAINSTAAILFIVLYTSELLTDSHFNSLDNEITALADDLILYSASNQINELENKLQNCVNRVNGYYSKWRLKVNPENTELTLFRNSVSQVSRNMKKNWRKFSVEASKTFFSLKTYLQKQFRSNECMQNVFHLKCSNRSN